MITAVDTNVLLDLLIPNARYLEDSKEALEAAHGEGSLILCEAVFAELASQFDERDEIQTFLADTGIQLVPASLEALFEASRAWQVYNRRRSKDLVCSTCGSRQPLPQCTDCSVPIPLRQHIISDFLIGAHAEYLSDRLLTRDRGFYKAYFGNLNLLSPTPPAP